MNQYHILVLPEVSKLFIPNPIILNQDVEQQTLTYTQGYGQLSKAGATVQLGVTGHIHIDMAVESLSESFYQDTTDEVTNTVSTSISHELREAASSKNYSNWWFAFLAGGSGAHDSSYYQKQQNNSVTITDTKYFKAASSKMSSHKQTYKVSGDFEIVGQSYVPTSVYLFIETLTIQTSEGTTLVIPTQNTAVADASGNTGAGSTSSKINIMPMG